MALALLSILVSPLTEMGKCLFVPLKRQISYLINYDENLENLRNQVRHLSTKRNDVKNLVDEARRRLEEPDGVVLEWLEEAATMGVNATNTLNEEMQVRGNKRCLKGLCPDWSARHRRMSKQALKMSHEINGLQARANFTIVSHVPPPPTVEPVRTHCVEGLTSRDLVMNQVTEALCDENIRSIGLYGMGGIGKTTLVNNLNNELQGNQLFKKVIMVIVSNSPDLKRIQDDIGRRLGLYLDPQSTSVERANKLFARLQLEETVLIILDDVWRRLELSDIGIPSGSEHMGCKIILTTRIYDVCREMGIRTTFKVEPLSEDESWVLFKEKAGNVVTWATLLPLAKKIARKCKGSPLAIVVLGSLLRDMEEEFEWNDVLRALESPDPIELEGIIPEVIISLRYSYDHLNGPEIKLCFLFFCMFPEDYNIPLSQMRDYGIGEGFLKVNKSLEDASNKLLVFVRKLKACGLLLDGSDDEHVMIHDVVRDVAISIASKDDNGFLIKAGLGLRKWPEMEKLNTYKRISFMENESIEFRSPLEGPQLLTLLLRGSWNLKLNPDNFFESLKSLFVLDLSDTYLDSVPKSLGHLINLRTLYLQRCELSGTISALGGLKNLEILRLSHSFLKRLPEEIGNLTNLRCLDLTGVRCLSNVAPNAISRLTKLEEFLVLRSFEGWDIKGCSYAGEINASLAEVALLPNLVNLRIKVKNSTWAYQDIPACSWKNLKEFSVILDAENTFAVPNIDLKSSSVHIHGANKIPNWVRILCQKASHLILSYCFGFNSLEYLVLLGSFSHLKRLHVEGCHEIEYLLSIGEEPPQDPFGSLEELIIRNMDNMKKIVHGPPPAKLFRNLIENDEGRIVAVKDASTSRDLQLTRYRESGAPKTFQYLTYLLIERCKILKSLFTFRLARSLEQLRKLSVHDCDVLEEIIAMEKDEEEEATSHHGLLPSLVHLELIGLPCLMSIYQGCLFIECSFELITVIQCPNLKRLPLKSQDVSYPVEVSGDFTWPSETESILESEEDDISELENA